MKTLDQRVLDDPQFAALVKHFEMFYETLQFTPSEIREAALLAQMRHEMRYPRLTYFSEDVMREIEFRTPKARP
jgi:hypothetical protein